MPKTDNPKLLPSAMYHGMKRATPKFQPRPDSSLVGSIAPGVTNEDGTPYRYGIQDEINQGIADEESQRTLPPPNPRPLTSVDATKEFMQKKGVLSRDLCPTCGINYPLNGYMYCSKRCGDVARNFRKRLMFERKFLESVGFVVTFHNGVQLEIKLPSALAPHYVKHSCLIVWPCHPMTVSEIESLNASDLWEVLIAHLGRLVGGYLMWQYAKPSVPGMLASRLLGSVVKVAAGDFGVTCPTCERELIYTHEGINESTLCCTDCTDPTSHPF